MNIYYIIVFQITKKYKFIIDAFNGFYSDYTSLSTKSFIGRLDMLNDYNKEKRLSPLLNNLIEFIKNMILGQSTLHMY